MVVVSTAANYNMLVVALNVGDAWPAYVEFFGLATSDLAVTGSTLKGKPFQDGVTIERLFWPRDAPIIRRAQPVARIAMLVVFKKLIAVFDSFVSYGDEPRNTFFRRGIRILRGFDLTTRRENEEGHGISPTI